MEDVKVGSHESLMKKEGNYFNLVLTQNEELLQPKIRN